MRNVFEVDEPAGERWNLALELLMRGESAVAIGSLNVYRDANGARADGRVHVEIRATREPSSLTVGSAGADVETGLHQLDELLAHDRFAALAAEHGITTEYVSDYETGRIVLASVAADRSIAWKANFEPRT
jgi:hypothetical protein